MIKKIISGGQTGADQAGLDVAIELGIPHGGWIPKGRKTEEGILPGNYKLSEMNSTSYPKRTEKNVLESEGTVIFTTGSLAGGSALTRKLANKHERPVLHVNFTKMTGKETATTVSAWIESHSIEVLNVAGSRASKNQNIYQNTKNVLKQAIIPLNG
jgi:hypothetical protein